MKMTRTKIIATIGPSCRDSKVLTQMIEAGMDVARINCSHASPDFIESVVPVPKSARANSKTTCRSNWKKANISL
jgi:pyruvate kinase